MHCLKSPLLQGGGSGFIGSYIVRAFEQIGSKVWTISRMPGQNSITWVRAMILSCRAYFNVIFLVQTDVQSNGLPRDTQVVINVAGQNVLDPKKGWSAGFKQNVIASRVNTTHILAEAVIRAKTPPQVFATISGVGYYAPSLTNEYTENSKGGDHDFFSNLCSEWEAAGEIPNSLPTRRVIVRSGVVLGFYGGMIKQLYLPFYLGVGGHIASGNQWMPWIHIEDIVRMFLFAAEDETVTGVLNGVAPQAITNAHFTKALARAMWRPALIPIPEFALNFAFHHERARMMIEGQKVIPKRVQELGFQYVFPDIDSACQSIANDNY